MHAGADLLARGVDAARRHERVRGHHRAGQLAEIPGPHPRRRHRRRLRQRALGPRRLVVAEEERPAAHERPAEHAAEDVLVERPLAHAGPVVVPGVGVQRLVAEELEQRPVELVGALLHRRVDHGAGGLAELRGIRPRLHLELLQRVHRRRHDLGTALLEVGRHRIVVGAVEGVVVPGGEVAVGVEERVLAAAGDAGRGDDHAGGQQRQLGVAAAEQRQVAHLPLVDDRPDVCRLRLQQFTAPGHRDRFGERSHLEHEVDAAPILHAQCDLGAHGPAKSLQLGAHRVDAHAQSREDELAAAVGHRRLADPGGVLRGGHRHPGQHRARAVGHRPDDGTRVELCGRRHGGAHAYEQR